MSIPDYFQEIYDFRSPNGHPHEADFIAEGLTEIDPATGDPIWNAAGQAVINEIISSRFEQAVQLYDFIRYLEPGLSDPQIARQAVARGYYAMFSAGRALSLALCGRDWGMGSGNHGNLPTHLDIHTRGDSWYPNFHHYLKDWRALRNCADYDLFTLLEYSGRYAGRRPPRVTLHYASLDDAATYIGRIVEEYLRETQRLITLKGVHLVRTV
ncbi:MAG: hypothetical protein ACPGWR_02705 [Ardenticatenaceae bacterium]